MAYTQSDIEALKAAIASGAFKVRFADGREITYRSLKDMEAILLTITEEVNGAQSSVSYASFVRN